MLYFAYGSNLNVAHMARRCPRAVPLRKFIMPDARLVFRGVADCIHEPGAKCPGGIWRITADCERALDRYEGFRADDPDGGMYRKAILQIAGMGAERELMVYVMNSTGIFPPSQSYLETIRQGYKDFRLPVRTLKAAVAASYDDKAPSHVERKRYRRDGRPRLARHPRATKAAKAVTTGSPTTGNLFGN